MAEPKISGLSPSSIGASSRTAITISGSGLDKVDYVWFGSNRVYPSSKSSSSVTVTSPSLSIGSYSVYVHTSDSWSSNSRTLTVVSSAPPQSTPAPTTVTTPTTPITTASVEQAQSNLGVVPSPTYKPTSILTLAVTPLPTPSILNMSQTSIPADVITQLVINGTYFGKLDGSPGYVASAVYFYPITGESAGGAAALGTIRNVEYGTKITVDTPRLSPGTYSVVVQICRYATACTSAGDYKNSSGKTLTVVSPVIPTPRIDSINPSTIEPNKSVSNIYINGANLADVNRVVFDGIPGRVDRATDFYVIVSMSPLPSKAATTVTITTSSGKSASGVITVSQIPVRDIPFTVTSNIDAYFNYDGVQIGRGQSASTTIKQDGNDHTVTAVSVNNSSIRNEKKFTAFKDSSSSYSMYLPLVLPAPAPAPEETKVVKTVEDDVTTTENIEMDQLTLANVISLAGGLKVPRSGGFVVIEVPVRYTVKVTDNKTGASSSPSGKIKRVKLLANSDPSVGEAGEDLYSNQNKTVRISVKIPPAESGKTSYRVSIEAS